MDRPGVFTPGPICAEWLADPNYVASPARAALRSRVGRTCRATHDTEHAYHVVFADGFCSNLSYDSVAFQNPEDPT